MDRPLRIAPADEYDQVVRLGRFRAAHPEVHIRDLERGGLWRATVPLAGGELDVTRILLKDVLDELDELNARGTLDA